ncbi:MAG: lysylphosphatidylglycerol synthase transmembrane domain-containing protein [Acidimicrobiales bacterium]
MKDGSVVGGGANRRKVLVRIVSIVFVALCVAFIVHLLVSNWTEVSRAVRHARLWLFAPAAVCAIGGMYILAWRWGAAIVTVGGERGRSHRVISAFFVGEAGKYIPGAIWAMLGRSELAHREGYERPVAYSSVALSVIGCYLAASLTAIVFAAIALLTGSLSGPWWPIVVVAAAGLILIHPAVSRRLLGLVGRVLGRTLEVDMPNWTSCLRLAVSYVPVWVLIAAATSLVTASLVPHPPIARVAFAAVVSWIIGFITPAPGGIGVREAVFVAVAGVASGPAAAAALLARVLFVGVDAAGAGIGWLVLRMTEPAGELGATRRSV